MGFNKAPEIITIPTNEFGDLTARRKHIQDGPFSFIMGLINGPLVGGMQATAVEIMYRLNYSEALKAAGIYAASNSLNTFTLNNSDKQRGFLHFTPPNEIIPLTRDFVLENTPDHTIKRP